MHIIVVPLFGMLGCAYLSLVGKIYMTADAWQTMGVALVGLGFLALASGATWLEYKR